MADVATVTSKGQITLPASVRRRLGLREGSRVVFLDTGEDIRLMTEDALEEWFGVFDEMRRRAGLTRAALQKQVEEARARVGKRHYARRR